MGEAQSDEEEVRVVDPVYARVGPETPERCVKLEWPATVPLLLLWVWCPI